MSARVLGFRFWVLGYRFWEPESESSPLPRRKSAGEGSGVRVSAIASQAEMRVLASACGPVHPNGPIAQRGRVGTLRYVPCAPVVPDARPMSPDWFVGFIPQPSLSPGIYSGAGSHGHAIRSMDRDQQPALAGFIHSARVFTPGRRREDRIPNTTRAVRTLKAGTEPRKIWPAAIAGHGGTRATFQGALPLRAFAPSDSAPYSRLTTDDLK
jgi:hypothetical protein